jgi:osmotically-inducible protein OsmY
MVSGSCYSDDPGSLEMIGEVYMKGSKYLVLALLLVLTGGSLIFADTAPQASVAFRSDDEIVTDFVRNFRARVSTDYVFNSVSVKSENGNLVLSGKVRDGYIIDRAMDAAKKVQGVQSITNRIELLPASAFDDRLRVAIYRRLSRDGALFHYFIGYAPGINIIVENSRVTLIGEVNSRVDKVRAASRVRELFGVLSVDDQLIVTRG